MGVAVCPYPGVELGDQLPPFHVNGSSKGMTQHVAYKWSGHLYCEDCIVAMFTEHFPWHVWLDTGGSPATDDAETELDQIAHLFRIDRESPAEVTKHGFPEYVGKHHPGFCSFCHRWFEED